MSIVEQAITDMEKVTRNNWEFAAALMRALPRKMAPELMLAWRENPTELQEVLARLNPPPKDPKKILSRPKMVEFGGYFKDEVRKSGLLNRLSIAGRDVTEIMKMMINSPTFVLWTEYSTAKVVTASNRDFGLPAGAKYIETVARAQEIGLEKCTPEIAVEYAIAYSNQPLGEEIHVPIDPIKIEGSQFPQHTVIVSHPDTRGKLLSALPTSNSSEFAGKHRFAFMIRK